MMDDLGGFFHDGLEPLLHSGQFLVITILAARIDCAPDQEAHQQ